MGNFEKPHYEKPTDPRDEEDARVQKEEGVERRRARKKFKRDAETFLSGQKSFGFFWEDISQKKKEDKK